MTGRCEALTGAREGGLRACRAMAVVEVERIYSRPGQPPPTPTSYWHSATHYFCDRHRREAEFVPAHAVIVAIRRAGARR